MNDKGHWGQHDDDCFGCKVASISISSSAMPTRSQGNIQIVKKEKKLTEDREAFKAMRDQGIQPARLTGAADLQRHATTKREIETGKILPKKIAQKVEAAAKELKKK